MIRAYFTERFPLIPLLFFTTATGYAMSKYAEEADVKSAAVISLLYLSFLFHLRILDEFKDFRYDTRFHPERPLQKGLVTPMQLKTAGAANIMLLLGIATVSRAVLFLSIALFYTVFMYFEFFLGDRLRRHTTLYLVSHQIVFIPLFLSFFSTISRYGWQFIWVEDAAFFFYILLPIFLIEIGRKMRHRQDQSGKITDDTYAYTWGERNSLFVFSGLIILCGTLGLMIPGYNPLIAPIFVASGLILGVFGFFHTQVITRYHMAITIIFGLSIPIGSLL